MREITSNEEKDYEFFLKHSLFKIIIKAIIFGILEIAVIYFYFLIAKQENILDAFSKHPTEMIILPFIPFVLFCAMFSMFKEDINYRKDILKRKIFNKKNKIRLYFSTKESDKYNNEFGNIVYTAKKNKFYNYIFLCNLLVPIIFILLLIFSKKLEILKLISGGLMLFLILNMLKNILSKIEFYEFGLIVYSPFSKIKINYYDIYNFSLLYENNKNKSRFNIGTNYYKINIDTIKYAVKFTISTSKIKEKKHEKLKELDYRMKEMLESN